MGKPVTNKSSLSFSLDCELIWGIDPNKVSYVKHNVAKANENLRQILEYWPQYHSQLFLAFTAATLISYREFNSHCCDEGKDILTKRGYGEFRNVQRYQIYDLALDPKKENVHYGIHGEFHEFLTYKHDTELVNETNRVISFVQANKIFSSIYIYPKNLVPSNKKVNQCIADNFRYVRINSQSWIYNNNVYNKMIRFLRILDSFLPLYELTILTTNHQSNTKNIVGDFYYRAQLPRLALELHVIRLVVGVFILRLFGKSAHIWSHPHNFTTSASIRYFCNYLPKL